MDEQKSALQAARNSWRCVRAKDKQAWLDLMADEVLVEDPIGVAPTNPSGEGIRGKEAVGKFWDAHIAPATIRIEPHSSFAVPGESAHLLTLSTHFDNGVRTRVKGIFVYRVDDAGKITNLRGYWTLADMKVERSDEAEKAEKAEKVE